MKSAFVSAAIAAVFTLAAPATVVAAEPAFSFNIAATNDYVWRGLSQSNEDPAIQGGIDFNAGSFYAGSWASTVDFADSTDIEWDFYAGLSGTSQAFDWDVSATYYTYVDAPSGADYNFVEFKAAASRSFGALNLGTAVHYSPDFYGADKSATYIEASGEYALNDRLSISGGVGRQFLNVTEDYTAWNGGAAYTLSQKLSLDIRYWYAPVDSPLGDARVSVTLGAAF